MMYQTHDHARGGNLALGSRNGTWRIWKEGVGEDLAVAQDGFSNGNSSYLQIHDNISELRWQTRSNPASHLANAPHASVTVRHGGRLQDLIMSFARAHNISISKIYLLDDSSTHTLQNAFAAGIGESIIALSDNLFLGDNTSYGDGAAPGPLPNPLRPLEPEGPAQMLSLLRQADTPDSTEDPVLRRHISRPMTRGEILGILGHELGHAALGHVARMASLQAFNQGVSLGVLGICLWNPKVHAALATLGAHPNSMLHISYLLYTHVTGFLVDSFLHIVRNVYISSNEYAADSYSAEVSEEYATNLQSGLAKLTVNTNQDPDEPWIYEFLHRDHPTLAHRWANIQAIKDRLYPRSEAAAAAATPAAAPVAAQNAPTTPTAALTAPAEPAPAAPAEEPSGAMAKEVMIV